MFLYFPTIFSVNSRLLQSHPCNLLLNRPPLEVAATTTVDNRSLGLSFKTNCIYFLVGVNQLHPPLRDLALSTPIHIRMCRKYDVF